MQEVLVDILFGALPVDIESIDIVVCVDPMINAILEGARLNITGIHTETVQDSLGRVGNGMDDRHYIGGVGDPHVFLQAFIRCQRNRRKLGAT